MSEIEINARSLIANLAQDRRHRAEIAASAQHNELAGLLLPLAVALSRLTARRNVAEAHL